MARGKLGSNLRGGNRLMRAFHQNTQPLGQVQSHTQGANFAIQELLAGLGIGQDEKDRKLAMEAIQKALIEDPPQEIVENPDASDASIGTFGDDPDEASYAEENPLVLKGEKPRPLLQKLLAASTAPGMADNSHMQDFQQSLIPSVISRDLLKNKRTYEEGRTEDARRHAGGLLMAENTRADKLLREARTHAEKQSAIEHKRALEVARVKFKDPNSYREYQLSNAQFGPNDPRRTSYIEFLMSKAAAAGAGRGGYPVPKSTRTEPFVPYGAPGAPGGAAPLPQGAVSPYRGAPYTPPAPVAPQAVPPVAPQAVPPVAPQAVPPVGAADVNMDPNDPTRAIAPPVAPQAVPPVAPQAVPPVAPQGGMQPPPPQFTPTAGTVPGSPSWRAQHKAWTDAHTAYRAQQKAAIKQSTTDRKRGIAQTAQERAGGTVIEDTGRALEMSRASGFATGLTNAIFSAIPSFGVAENPAFDLAEMVGSIEANTGINELMTIKKSSETGGALGQVPQSQLNILMQLLGNLDPKQNKDIFEDNIMRVQNLWMDIVHGSKEQIQGLLDKGLITPEVARKNARRHELSFDDMGRTRRLTLPEGVTAADVYKTQRAEKYGSGAKGWNRVIREYNRMNGLGL